jgi:hypothetical protein
MNWLSQAKWVSAWTRQLVGLLADTLYLTVLYQLARALTCVQSKEGGQRVC